MRGWILAFVSEVADSKVVGYRLGPMVHLNPPQNGA
jgi:hypothetical protein